MKEGRVNDSVPRDLPKNSRVRQIGEYNIMDEGQENEMTLTKVVYASMTTAKGLSPLYITRYMNEKGFHVSKSQVNRALYTLHVQGRAKKTRASGPPLWVRIEEETHDEMIRKDVTRNMPETGRTFVYIDLDNIHDCFERAAEISAHDETVYVHGYCGQVYNNWDPDTDESMGTNDKPAVVAVDKKRVVLHRMKESFRDLGKLVMFRDILWHFRRDVQSTAEITDTYILCSRDKRVPTMQYILQTLHNVKNVHVVKSGWDELKMFLE